MPPGLDPVAANSHLLDAGAEEGDGHAGDGFAIRAQNISRGARAWPKRQVEISPVFLKRVGQLGEITVRFDLQDRAGKMFVNGNKIISVCPFDLIAFSELQFGILFVARCDFK